MNDRIFYNYVLDDEVESGWLRVWLWFLSCTNVLLIIAGELLLS